jgi:hypothetical protein
LINRIRLLVFSAILLDAGPRCEPY